VQDGTDPIGEERGPGPLQRYEVRVRGRLGERMAGAVEKTAVAAVDPVIGCTLLWCHGRSGELGLETQ
jgi:hypothetical protein